MFINMTWYGMSFNSSKNGHPNKVLGIVCFILRCDYGASENEYFGRYKSIGCPTTVVIGLPGKNGQPTMRSAHTTKGLARSRNFCMSIKNAWTSIRIAGCTYFFPFDVKMLWSSVVSKVLEKSSRPPSRSV